MTKTTANCFGCFAILSMLWPPQCIGAVWAEKLPGNPQILQAAVKELQKSDQFNVRVALRRALDANKPRYPFHWHNPYTNHSGTITLLNAIQVKEHGPVCVPLMHEYYTSESPQIKHETTVCRDSAGNWNDIKSLNRSSAPTYLQLYAAETVFQIQGALRRLGYNPGSVDGVFGDRTQQAIENFERDEELPITGVITVDLSEALKRSVHKLKGASLESKAQPSDQGRENSEIAAAAARVSAEETTFTAVKKGTAAQSSGAGVGANRASADDTTASEPYQPSSTGLVSKDLLGKRPAGNAAAGITVAQGTPAAAPAETESAVSTELPVSSTLLLDGQSHSAASLSVAEKSGNEADGPTAFVSLRQNFMQELNSLIYTGRAKIRLFFQASLSRNTFLAITGLAGSIVFGLLAWMITVKTSASTVSSSQQSKAAERELHAKIAIVTGQRDRHAVAEIKPRRPAVNGARLTVAGRQITAGAETRPDTEGGGADRQGPGWLQENFSASREKAVPVATNEQGVKVKKSANSESRSKTSPSSRNEPLVLTGGMAGSSKDTDKFTNTLRAIKEAEELIGRAQQILKKENLDGTTQASLAQAIYIASKLVRDAVARSPAEEPSDGVTIALQDASGLIRVALDKSSRVGAP